MIERLASLPPVQGALDQIVQRFGTDVVAEITGRSRRIVRKTGDGIDRLAVESRVASANLAEAQAFMDDEKRILVFSDAGGTGRSYHADLAAKNQRLRVHYLLEDGWRADTAIQGLGRSNRTNQAQPPLFRPIAIASTPLAPSPRASVRPAARACSAPRTILNPSIRGRR
jgi:C-terminal domain on Strawberry notch homologue